MTPHASTRTNDVTNDEVVIALDPHRESNTTTVMDRTERVLVRGRFRHNDAGIAETLDTVAGHEWPRRADRHVL